jgi:hypothetical protein
MFSKSKILYLCYVDTKLKDEKGDVVRIEGHIKLLGSEAYASLLEHLKGFDYDLDSIVTIRFDFGQSKFTFRV